jgi:molybdopterin molybdotransferase
MINSTEALKLIFDNFNFNAEVEIKHLSELSKNDVLAEVIFADRDFPPFNRVMMDGIATHSKLIDWKLPIKIKNKIMAGENCLENLNHNEAFIIATGASLPECCDLVVQKELLKFDQSHCLYIGESIPESGKNIHFQGKDHKMDDVLFAKNHHINAGTVAALAAIGRDKVKVYKSPTIKILSTGNEVVKISEKPTKTQIRDANSSLINFKLSDQGFNSHFLGIAKDEQQDLRTKLIEGLNSDVLIISAGVSAGDKDLVPSLLKELGVKEIFHHVNIKPGKPLWFGRNDKTYVFGLPGNPLSVLVTLELFVLPLLKKMSNKRLEKISKAKLAHGYLKKEKREEWILGHLDNGFMELMMSSSSGDMIQMSLANKIVKFNSGEKDYLEHEEISWRNI